MKPSIFATAAALVCAMAAGQAHAIPVVGGVTTVTLVSAPTLTGAGVTVGLLGTATAVAGPGVPVVQFPITGGDLSASFAGTIEHVGSGLSLTTSTGSISLTNFLIDTVSLTLSGAVAFGTTTLSNVPLFSLTNNGNAASPFNLTLSATAAGALVNVLGVPNLTGALIATAATAPITAVAAIPEPSTYALMLGGLGLAGWVARRRKTAAAVSAC
jgi:PEP-CTERM motif